MASVLQISAGAHISPPFNRNSFFASKLPHPNPISFSRRNYVSSFYRNGGFKFVVSGRNLSLRILSSMGIGGSIVFERLHYEENKTRKRRRRVVLVSSNQGLKFNGSGGGGDDDDKGSKVLVNLVLAIGLYYLSTTEQFGWILDAIVKLGLFVVFVPLVGLGAFIWWIVKDSVVDSCPNCGNEFQVFKSTLDEDYQQCPYCAQPFSVIDEKFVKDPVNPSYQSTASGQAFNNFWTRSKKGKKSSASVVDVEAEIKDVD